MLLSEGWGLKMQLSRGMVPSSVRSPGLDPQPHTRKEKQHWSDCQVLGIGWGWGGHETNFLSWMFRTETGKKNPIPEDMKIPACCKAGNVPRKQTAVSCEFSSESSNEVHRETRVACGRPGVSSVYSTGCLLSPPLISSWSPRVGESSAFFPPFSSGQTDLRWQRPLQRWGWSSLSPPSLYTRSNIFLFNSYSVWVFAWVGDFIDFPFGDGILLCRLKLA